MAWVGKLFTDKNGDADEIVVFGVIAIVAMSIALLRNAVAGPVDLGGAGMGFGALILAIGSAIGARDGWPGVVRKLGGQDVGSIGAGESSVDRDGGPRPRVDGVAGG